MAGASSFLLVSIPTQRAACPARLETTRIGIKRGHRAWLQRLLAPARSHSPTVPQCFSTVHEVRGVGFSSLPVSHRKKVLKYL
jgi:hypothetical protein